MIYRFMFVGYSNNVHSVKSTGNRECYTFLSCKENMIFMYVEANSETVDPDKLAEGELIPYPDGKKWERAAEIYHYSMPVNARQWNRKSADAQAFMTFNRLKPEKTASYIFYHYQLQEERLGIGDRYGIIFIFHDKLIFYHERPRVQETETMQGLLQTKNSPIERWDELMNEHFVDSWHEIESLEKTAFIGFC